MGPKTRPPRALSIRGKLIAVLVATTTAGLLLAGVALALLEIVSYRRALAEGLTTLADIVGANSTAALTFTDPKAAREILAALRAQPEILSGCLYTNEGELFAEYARSEGGLHCPVRLGMSGPTAARRSPGATFTNGVLVLERSVQFQAQHVGTIRLVSDLSTLRGRMALYALTLALVLTAAALIALLVSSPLQRLVSGPILALAGTARRITEEQDYSLRAPKRTHDEVGVAVDAFNKMLERIQDAEAQLRALNSTLEQRVAERTAAAEQRAAELKRSNAELESFAYVASHDLQEPLRAVASYTQLLRQQLADRMDPDAELYIGHAIAGAERMRALINDLLQYSRVGRRALAFERTDIGQIVRLAKADLASGIAESGATVTVGELPVLWADPMQIGQLFRNLISNAIKFRGPEPPRVHISAERVDGEWRFAVRDNGIGIDSKYHERIFVIFQRLHGRDRPGTGIGLAICKKIVERHRGRIWVDSAPGKGAIFYFTLGAAERESATVAGENGD